MAFQIENRETIEEEEQEALLPSFHILNPLSDFIDNEEYIPSPLTEYPLPEEAPETDINITVNIVVDITIDPIPSLSTPEPEAPYPP